MDIKAIIVDDEQKSREVLKNLIENFCSGVDIVATADDIDSGASAIVMHKPDLVFLDISLKTGDSFNIIKRLPNLNFCCVFVTAYNENSISLLQYCNIPCLLKPIDLDLLENTINESSNPLWEGLQEQKNLTLKHLLSQKTTEIPIITKQKTVLLNPEEIAAVVLQNKKGLVYTKSNELFESIHLPLHFESILNGKLLFNNQIFVNESVEYSLIDNGIILSSGKFIGIDF